MIKIAIFIAVIHVFSVLDRSAMKPVPKDLDITHLIVISPDSFYRCFFDEFYSFLVIGKMLDQ